MTTSDGGGSSVTGIGASNLISVGTSNSSQDLPQESVGLSITGFPSLNNLTFPVLRSIQGGLNISSNPDLGVINMTSLETIGGDLDLTGNLTSILLPSLKNVVGSILVESTYASINCGRKVGGILRGVNYGYVFVCEAGVESPRPWPLPTYVEPSNNAATSTSAGMTAPTTGTHSGVSRGTHNLNGNFPPKYVQPNMKDLHLFLVCLLVD